ncbi:putative tail protein [Pectobacterium phage DU_PP_V]|uniref:Putative tail protein n=1 Tax=Pectobacterium phage DU_PP_V TaxID=2041492 RepID=A0A2D2W798_9CAUD|nr:putative tail protein [Pectobacterium phage DU_PP_V]ATS94094.1 putative tail protein [Pectobacterium phage DU_PP_V]
MKKVLDSAIEYLDNTSRIDMACLVAIQLPSDGSSTQSYAYFTNYYKNISFRGNLYVSGKIRSISSHKQDRKLTIGSISFTVAGTDQDEVVKLVQNGVSFLDRSVVIYQAVIREDGSILPFSDDDTQDPFLYFNGKINSGGIKDNVTTSGNGSSVITWQCSNQFYDFDRVNGRYTDDATHRALEVVNGELVPSDSVKREEYKTDMGFYHSNKSVNILAKYQVQELRYRLNKKKKLFGLSASYSMEEYYETVTKTVDIDFNLAAKFLPVVYGVQNVPGIPIFADTEKNNPNIVYVIYAFCEGEIEGFLDIQVGDAPLICYDDSDASDRTCFGRKRVNGDTMHRLASGLPTSDPSTHGQEYIYNDGNGEIRFWTFHGKSNQEAAQVLVDLAATQGFYLQSMDNIGPEYWDSRYQLLDTAYVIARYTINENRADIPTINADVAGKKIRVYNENGLVSNQETSLNGIWQTLDYLTSDIYGAGIPLDLIPLDNMVAQAKLLDIIDTSYEVNWNTYWRYTGWKVRFAENRQVVQLNTIIDTAQSVFKNVQEVLDSYKGAINTLSGEYRITIEKWDANPRKINFLDTFGNLELSDTTGRNKFNSVQASLSDPSMGWKANSVTFFDSNFKKQDNGLDKKLQLSFGAITNYYTARSFAARELKKSRYSRTLSFTLPYKFIGIEPNDAISFTYDRYGWEDKYFLVDEVENNTDGSLDVVLQEYGEDVFINSPQTENNTTIPIETNTILPPRDVLYEAAVIADGVPGVNGYVSWLPSLTNSVTYYSVRTSYSADSFVVESINPNPNERMRFVIREQPEGLVTIEIRAVDITGKRSSPVTLSFMLNPATNLSMVSNFEVVNRVAGTNEFAGSDVQLRWSAIPETGIIEDLVYRVQVYSSSNMIREVLTSSLTYTYSLVFNKQDYQAEHQTLGINRNLDFRIRAEGSKGEQSIGWTNI